MFILKGNSFDDDEDDDYSLQRKIIHHKQSFLMWTSLCTNTYNNNNKKKACMKNCRKTILINLLGIKKKREELFIFLNIILIQLQSIYFF